MKKTEDMNKYMKEYMRAKYKQDPMKSKMYQNSLYTMKKYQVDGKVWEKYGYTLHHIVAMKKMIDQLPNGIFETFLMEYKTMDFPPKDLGEKTTEN